MTESGARDNDPSAGMSIALMPAEGVCRDDAEQITELFAGLVSGGAALGWVEPPGSAAITDLLDGLAADVAVDDACVSIARSESGRVGGIAYWTRYSRPTYRPHVDIEKVAVDPRAEHAGVGRGLMNALIASARDIGVEVMTLDLRDDNVRAIALYRSLGFERYGLLKDFVAVGDQRYDKHLFALDLRR